MKVRVRLFALYRELVGRPEIEVELRSGATVGDLASHVAREYPKLDPHHVVFAVNTEYVDAAHPLADGDEVAFLPPVSGGDLFRVTAEPLNPGQITERVRRDEYGAVLTFLGTVRSPSAGRNVLYLEYDAYPEMAEKKLEQIAQEIQQKWGLRDVAVVHRTGRVEVGEISLVVAIGAPHRAEAFAACQYVVNRIKEIVPIWKKEVWEGGEVWVEERH